MRKILLFGIFLYAANFANAQCPVISGIFINACGASSEGWNEYVVLKNGSTPTLASNITIATPNNATVGYDTKANAQTLVETIFDPVITSPSCKSTGATPILKPIGPTDIIPSNATVILFTGGKFEDYPYSFDSFCGSSIYVLISLRSTGPGTGSFSNTAARTTTITTAGCGSTASYTYTVPANNDGEFASFTSPDAPSLAAGNHGTGSSGVSFLNNGCSVPPPVIVSVPVTKDTTISSCNTISFEGKTYTNSTVLDSTFKNINGADSVYRIVHINITTIIPLIKDTTINSCSNIVFEGKTYSALTVLDSTFKSVQGCDSMYRSVHLNITAITPFTKDTTISSCTNIVFESKIYTASTILDSTFKSVYGCDSVYRTVNIVITPITPVTKTIDTSGCNNIIFEGKTYTSSVTLDSTFKSIGGCDSIYRIVNIGITSITPVTKTIDTSSCSNIIFEGKTYAASTTLDSTFKNVGGCDSIYRIVNIVITSITPVTKTIDTTSCSNIIFEGKTYTAPTTLDSTFKSVYGCDSIYRIVNVVITPIIPVTKTIDTSSCSNVIFEGKTYAASTTLDSTFKSVGGCDSIYRIVNIVITPITPVIKTIDTSSCSSIIFEGKTYTASTTLDSTFKSVGGCDSIYRIININILVPINKTVNLNSCSDIIFEGKTYTGSTILDSTFKSIGGCDSIYRTVNIVIAPITPVTKTIDTSSCRDIIFEGKTYTGSTILDSTFKSVGGCDSVYRTVKININRIPVTNIVIDTASCGTLSYNGIVYTKSTALTNTIKSVGGCDSVITVTNITVDEIPEVSAGGPVIQIVGQGSVVLDGKILNDIGNDFTVVWTPNISINDTSILNPTVSPSVEQHYLLTVTSGKCSASDSVDVTRGENIVIPNSFSPNNDGVNEKWNIKNIEQFKSANVRIFNRYGQFVFESNGDYSNNEWDGTYHGQILPIGTYFYIIKLSSKAAPISGSVSIIR